MKKLLSYKVGLCLGLSLPSFAFAGDGAAAAAGLVSYFAENGPDLMQGLLQIIGGFALAAATFPTFQSGKGAKVLVILGKIVDFLGANWGYAKNNPKDAVKLE